MLCKTTIRAALAHVLGIVGILGAFGAGAAPDHPYATESLAGDAPYSVKATVGEILLDVEIDTLLEGDNNYYLVVNFWKAELTEQLDDTYTPTPGQEDVEGTAGDKDLDPNPYVKTEVGHGTGFRFYSITRSKDESKAGEDDGVDGEIETLFNTDDVLTRASRGDEGDSAGMYRVALEDGDDLEIGNRVRVELGQSTLAVPGSGTYYGDLYIYETRGDARAATLATDPADAPNTFLVHSQQKLFQISSKMTDPTIAPMLATADVAYDRAGDEENNVSTGGPFRGFAAGNGNVGLLAKITLNAAMNDPATDVDESMFLDVATGDMFDGAVNTGADFSVTAAPGAFGFGNGAGDGANGEDRMVGDDPATTDEVEDDHVLNAGGAPRAFRISTADDCTGGKHLTLTIDGDDINPLDDDDPTFAAEADGGEADNVSGTMFYFCVNVGTNEVAIPTVGDDRMMDGYEMTVTSLHGKTEGPSTTGAAGAIDRNGTTVNITYLSTHTAYNQRLVIVNRGAREAEFWMDTFQAESGTMVMSNPDSDLYSMGLRGTVDAGSRLVIRMQDALMVEGGNPRASGTLNLTAPTDDIDVMTLQVHPGTGQIDTTVY